MGRISHRTITVSSPGSQGKRPESGNSPGEKTVTLDILKHCRPEHLQPNKVQPKTMKKSALLLLMPLLSGTALAQEPQNCPEPTGCIRVSVSNLRNVNGLVGVALFRTNKGFPDKTEGAIEGKSFSAKAGEEIVFDNLPYGTYAISVLHDENGNRKMDKNFIGIPKEGFGTSNNPKIRRGPPSFDESRVTLDRKNLDLKIDMNYF
jgi:uncharacterized protein (DUF2141 family)